jgi:hypothetical protein
MKVRVSLFVLLVAAIIMGSCNKKENNDTTDPNLPTHQKLGKVGNNLTASFPLGQQLSISITNNDNGLVTLNVTVDRSSFEVKGKITENSISDFVYSKGDLSKPFTLVEFDAKVGDRYTFQLDEYNEVEREVVEVDQSYYIDCLGRNVPTIGIAEYVPPGFFPEVFGYTIEVVWWYFSPDYGIVCVGFTTSEGDYFEVEFNSIEVG